MQYCQLWSIIEKSATNNLFCVFTFSFLRTISDGEPLDDITEIAAKVNELAVQEKLAFWFLAVEGTNAEILHQLSSRRVLTLAWNLTLDTGFVQNRFYKLHLKKIIINASERRIV